MQGMLRHLFSFSHLRSRRLHLDGPSRRPLRQEGQAGADARPLRPPLRPGGTHPHLWVLRLQRHKAGGEKTDIEAMYIDLLS